MIKFKGRLLNFDSVDACNRKWSKDCKITFPDKVPVMYNFEYGIPPIGTAEISKDDEGLSCEATLDCLILTRDEYYVGGHYNDVKSHLEGSITVIDSCRLMSMSIIPEDQVADRNLKIRRIISMNDSNEFVEVDETKCEEVDNCFGVKEENGKRYCRGCGNVHPEKGENND